MEELAAPDGVRSHAAHRPVHRYRWWSIVESRVPGVLPDLQAAAALGHPDNYHYHGVWLRRLGDHDYRPHGDDISIDSCLRGCCNRPCPGSSVSGQLDKPDVYDRERNLEHRMGLPVHPASRVWAVVPSVRRIAWRCASAAGGGLRNWVIRSGRHTAHVDGCPTDRRASTCRVSVGGEGDRNRFLSFRRDSNSPDSGLVELGDIGVQLGEVVVIAARGMGGRTGRCADGGEL